MSTGDIAVVERFYSALARRDMDRVRALIAPEFVLDCPLAPVPWHGRYDGPDGFFEFFGLRHSVLDTRPSVERIFRSGNRIVVVARIAGTVRGSEVRIGCYEVALLEVRDRGITRCELFENTSALHAALGHRAGCQPRA